MSDVITPPASIPAARLDGRAIAEQVGLAVLLYLGGALGLNLATWSGNATPIWPPTGIAVAAMLWRGYRVWPAILIGTFAADYFIPNPATAAGLMAAGSTLEALIATWLIRRLSPRLAFLGALAPTAGWLVATVAAPVLSAAYGSTALVMHGQVAPEGWLTVGVTWWAGDAMGLLALAPALLTFRDDPLPPSSYPLPRRIALVVALDLALAAAVFLFRTPGVTLFLIFPGLLFNVALLGGRGSKLGAAFFIAMAIWAADRHTGPFVAGENVILLELFLAAVAISGQVLPTFRSSGGMLVPGIVLLVGWFGSGVIFGRLEAIRTANGDRDFARSVANAQDAVQARLDNYIDALHASTGLFAASRSVERGEWRAFADSLRLRERYPGVNGIGVIFPVRPAELDAFVAKVRLDEAPDFTVHAVPGQPAADPAIGHYIITYIEPQTINREAIGLDIASEAARRQAAQTARDTGTACITARIQLVQDHAARFGFLLYLPMYRIGAPVDTVAHRREALLGWIYAPFLTSNFFAGALADLPPGLSVSVFQGTGVDNPSLAVRLPHGGEATSVGFARTTTITLAGQDFTLGWNRSAEFVKDSPAPSLWAATACALGTLLFTGLILNLQNTSRRAREIAEERTHELQSVNSRLQGQMLDRARAERALTRSHNILEGIRGSHERFLGTGDGRLALEALLVAALKATGSKYGFIAEVRREEDGRMNLRLCVESPDANHPSRAALFEQLQPMGFDLADPANLFSRLVSSRAPQIVNLPAGGRLRSFLGLPCTKGERVVALAGFVDRSGGYTAELVTFLETWRVTCSNLLEAIHAAEHRRQTEVELRAAKVEAEAASRAKSEFLATMSHEIRTPLNSVIGFSQVLEGSDLSPEQREWVHVMQGSAESLLAIINDILDFSKIEAGRLDLEQVPFAPVDVAQEVVAIFRPTAAKKRLRLEATVDGPGPVGDCLGDAARFSQIVSNLVSNALKFTETGSVRVKLRWTALTAERATLRVDVIDTGIGIEAAKLPQLFEKFTQADSSTTRRFGGTGLGLAICRSLVNIMGGRIGVESMPGDGSTFWLEIPFDLAPAVFANPGDATAGPTPATLATGPRLRVLIAEDGRDNQMVAAALLASLGHESVVVADGAAAVDVTARERFDAVLMDLDMPELNGLEATKIIRRREAAQHGPRLPIIALTANAFAADRESCLQAGMDRYLAKPFAVEALAEALAACVPASTTT